MPDVLNFLYKFHVKGETFFSQVCFINVFKLTDGKIAEYSYGDLTFPPEVLFPFVSTCCFTFNKAFTVCFIFNALLSFRL